MSWLLEEALHSRMRGLRGRRLLLSAEQKNSKHQITAWPQAQRAATSACGAMRALRRRSRRRARRATCASCRGARPTARCAHALLAAWLPVCMRVCGGALFARAASKLRKLPAQSKTRPVLAQQVCRLSVSAGDVRTHTYTPLPNTPCMLAPTQQVCRLAMSAGGRVLWSCGRETLSLWSAFSESRRL